MHLELIQPTADFSAEFILFMEEFQAHGESRFDHELTIARRNFDHYLDGLVENAKGVHLPPGYVPQTSFWTVMDGCTIVGTLRIRHELTPHLEIEGGHIGYNIRPTFRRRGFGTAQLALGLEKAKALGLAGVLITCDTDNIGSAKIIVKNGGRFINGVVSPNTYKPISRYWIQLMEDTERKGNDEI